MESNNINREELKKKVLSQFRTGKSLFGKDGAFAPLLKEFLEEALQGELDAHLDEEERDTGNRKNGKQKKTVKTSQGSVDWRNFYSIPIRPVAWARPSDHSSGRGHPGGH